MRSESPKIRRGGHILSAAVAASLLTLFSTAPAGAHFLWAGVEGGAKPRLHLTFGETPDERTDAVPVSRLEPARARDASGKALKLAAGEGGLSGSLPAGPAVAAAQENWGVVDRSGDGTGAFLLEYFAKGAATLEEASRELKIPYEIVTRQDGATTEASFRHEGKASPGISVRLHLPSSQTEDRVSDERGEIRFDASVPGLYGLRARWIEDRKGTHEGKAFGEVRYYSTLTFEVAAESSSVAGGYPKRSPSAVAASGTRTKSDPAAYALLEAAHNNRQVMPPDFGGFRSRLIYQHDGKTVEGTLVYRRQGETEVAIDGLDAESKGWVKRQLLNLVGHRRGGDFAKGDGRYPLQLGPDDGNSYGRLVLINDDTQSSYRIRDNRVMEVTRTMEGSRFTISVIETMEADTGRYLANHFVVSYRDPKTGELQKIEGYRDGYGRVGGVWLPTSRTVLEISRDASPEVRTIRLRNVEHLEAPPQAASVGASR